MSIESYAGRGESDTATEWHRVAKIRLLIWPVILGPLLVPAVIIFLLAGARPWNAGFVAMVVVACWPVVVAATFGLDWLDWRAARHRVTGEHFDLRSGVVWRKRQSISRGRIRSVDVSANPVYRIFGLAVVRVGTGESVGAFEDSELKLDGVTRERADELRRQLLRRAPTRAYGPAGNVEAAETGGSPESRTVVELARMRRSWLRFAPLTLSVVLVIAAGLLGTAGDVFGGASGALASFLRDAVDVVGSIWLLATVALVAALLSGFVGSLLLFVEAWWNFRLLREPGGTLRVMRGLLTARSVSLEESRLRGAEVVEPLLVRWAGGARVNAVATGLSSKKESNKAADRKALLPPAPRVDAQRVAGDVIGEAILGRLRLTGHPRAALRRRLVWAVSPIMLLVAALASLGYVFNWMPGWTWAASLALLPLAATAAYDAFRSLGHGLSSRHLVSRYGTGIRRTVALQRDGVIGWNVSQSPFQRRADLVTVAATTAAGNGAYKVRDARTGAALAFADDAVPGLLRPFLVGMTDGEGTQS